MDYRDEVSQALHTHYVAVALINNMTEVYNNDSLSQSEKIRKSFDLLRDFLGAKRSLLLPSDKNVRAKSLSSVIFNAIAKGTGLSELAKKRTVVYSNKEQILRDDFESLNINEAIIIPLVVNEKIRWAILIFGGPRTQKFTGLEKLVCTIWRIQAESIFNKRYSEISGVAGDDKADEMTRHDLGTFLSTRIPQGAGRNTKDKQPPVEDPFRDFPMGARDVVIMFVDIRNSTGLGNILPMELFKEFFEKFYSEMGDVIFEFNGTVNKLMGDGILAVFGIFDDNTASAKDGYNRAECLCFRSTICAVEMNKKFNVFLKKWKRKLRDQYNIMQCPSLDLAIGINYGNVFLGTFKAGDRYEYTPLGVSVNEAQRLSMCAAKNIQEDEIDVIKSNTKTRKGVFTTKPIILSPTVYAKAEARIREAVNFVDEYEISSLKGLIGSIEIFGIEE